MRISFFFFLFFFFSNLILVLLLIHLNILIQYNLSRLALQYRPFTLGYLVQKGPINMVIISYFYIWQLKNYICLRSIKFFISSGRYLTKKWNKLIYPFLLFFYQKYLLITVHHQRSPFFSFSFFFPFLPLNLLSKVIQVIIFL